jgi:hypothetical protein
MTAELPALPEAVAALATELRALLVLLATDRHGNPWAYVESRSGSMVHVQPMIDRLDAAIDADMKENDRG